MGSEQPSSGERYAARQPLGGEGIVVRSLGSDRKLQRDVLIWAVDAPEGDREREQLFATARAAARMDEPGFLRVLDIVPTPDRLAVILEAPPEPWVSPEPGMPALIAAAIALEVGEAMEGAIAARLKPSRLSLEYLHADEDGRVRLDPVGVALPGTGRAAPAAAQVAQLLATLLGGRTSGSGTFDPGAASVRALATRWSGRAGTSDENLPRLVEELRSVAGVRVPPRADAVIAATARGPRSSYDEFERTARLEPWPPPEAGPKPAAGVAPAPRQRAAVPAATPPQRGENGATSPPEAVRERPAPPPQRAPGPPPSAPAPAGLRWTIAVPLTAAVLAVVLAIGGIFMTGGEEQPGTEPRVGNPAAEGFGPPLREAPGEGVTVGLAAQEDSNVRVTVDGVVEFDGVLRAGQRGSWEGTQRIQVWTDRGRSLLLSVNGQDLGPYSPAMGHPDWNRIDFGFWPGWQQADVIGTGQDDRGGGRNRGRGGGSDDNDDD